MQKSRINKKSNKRNKIINYSIFAYLLIFGVIMMIYHIVNIPVPCGDFDDFSLPIASFLNDLNFSISSDDLAYYKELFPHFAEAINNYSLSGFMASNGAGELTSYFPIYSILCIPATLMFKLLGMPTVYAFPYTNLTILLIALFIVYRKLKVKPDLKLILIVALSFNPIVFYISWPSSEVLIYSLLIIGLTFFYNRDYIKAIIPITIATMLNPLLMVVGITMIIDYFIQVFSNKVESKVSIIVSFICCFIVSFIPMIFNYINTGHLLLVSINNSSLLVKENFFQRFIAYLFDLNYGFLPYFFIIILLSLFLIPVSIKNKQSRYIEWLLTFIIIVLLCSFMSNINNEMSGIARYSSWSSALLIFGVVVFGYELLSANKIFSVFNILISIGAVITVVIVFIYNPFHAANAPDTDFTPIAKVVLNNTPGLYNPLHSTFISRTSKNIDEKDRDKEVPFIYYDNDGSARKILTTENGSSYLVNNYSIINDNSNWFNRKLYKLKDTLSYISVPKKYGIYKNVDYSLDNPIIFSNNGYNASEYVISGIGNSEETGSWTSEKELIMCLRMKSEDGYLRMNVNAIAIDDKQDINVYVNDEKAYSVDNYSGNEFSFEFENPGYDKMVKICIKFPKAVNLRDDVTNKNQRVSIMIEKMTISKSSNTSMYKIGDVIDFTTDDYNADGYIKEGMFAPEDWGSWTDGNKAVFEIKTNSKAKKLHALMYAHPYNYEQNITILVNGEEVYKDEFDTDLIEFYFDNSNIITIEILLPDAISPKDLGQSEDARLIALGINKLMILEQ